MSSSALVAREPDDFELMESIAAGDDRAMRTLYDRYGALLYTLALRILCDAGEAEEVLQEVLWETWQRADRFNPTRGNPRTYLVTLVRSRAIDRHRSRRSRRDTPVESEKMAGLAISTTTAGRDRTPEEDAISREQGNLVRGALANLDAFRRQAIELAYFDGLSQTEIAAELNTPLGTVKSWIRQGLIQLRSALGAPNSDRDPS